MGWEPSGAMGWSTATTNPANNQDSETKAAHPHATLPTTRVAGQWHFRSKPTSSTSHKPTRNHTTYHAVHTSRSSLGVKHQHRMRSLGAQRRPKSTGKCSRPKPTSMLTRSGMPPADLVNSKAPAPCPARRGLVMRAWQQRCTSARASSDCWLCRMEMTWCWLVRNTSSAGISSFWTKHTLIMTFAPASKLPLGTCGSKD